MLDGIDFRYTKEVLEQLLPLFRDEQWHDFMDPDEVQLYLHNALLVLTAWQGSELIGFARLGGEAPIWVEITDLLVRRDFQGRGIGTELVRRLVERIRELDPYHINVNPISDREVHLYSKFGFAVVEDYKMMQMPSSKLAGKLAKARNPGRNQ